MAAWAAGGLSPEVEEPAAGDDFGDDAGEGWAAAPARVGAVFELGAAAVTRVPVERALPAVSGVEEAAGWIGTWTGVVDEATGGSGEGAGFIAAWAAVGVAV